MTTLDVDDRAQAIACRLRLPVLWRAGEAAPSPGEHLHALNLHRLLAIEALEAHSGEATEYEPGQSVEIQRLDHKLNLALDLLGLLLAQQQQRPPDLELELTPESACWHSDADPAAPGQRGRLELYLHPLVPGPVVLPATRTAAPDTADEALPQHACRFDPMPDDVADALTAHVFRCHRRQVARDRGGESC